MGQDCQFEFQAAVESLPVLGRVGEDKIGHVVYLKIPGAKKPLVKFGLDLIPLFPLIIQGNFFCGAGRFVVNDVIFARWINPNIVDGAKHLKIGRLVDYSYSLEILPPDLQLLVPCRNRVDPIVAHERMRLPFGPPDIEFLFKQMIHGRVQRKPWSRRDFNPQALFQVKTARTLQEHIHL